MIRISGDFGGVVIIILFAMLVAGVVTWVLEFIKKQLPAGSAASKVLSVLIWVIWLAAIALVVLDITDVAPIIRNVLFSLLD